MYGIGIMRFLYNQKHLCRCINQNINTLQVYVCNGVKYGIQSLWDHFLQVSNMFTYCSQNVLMPYKRFLVSKFMPLRSGDSFPSLNSIIGKEAPGKFGCVFGVIVLHK